MSNPQDPLPPASSPAQFARLGDVTTVDWWTGVCVQSGSDDYKWSWSVRDRNSASQGSDAINHVVLYKLGKGIVGTQGGAVAADRGSSASHTWSATQHGLATTDLVGYYFVDPRTSGNVPMGGRGLAVLPNGMDPWPAGTAGAPFDYEPVGEAMSLALNVGLPYRISVTLNDPPYTDPMGVMLSATNLAIDRTIEYLIDPDTCVDPARTPPYLYFAFNHGSDDLGAVTDIVTHVKDYIGDRLDGTGVKVVWTFQNEPETEGGYTSGYIAEWIAQAQAMHAADPDALVGIAGLGGVGSIRAQRTTIFANSTARAIFQSYGIHANHLYTVYEDWPSTWRHFELQDAETVAAGVHGRPYLYGETPSPDANSYGTGLYSHALYGVANLFHALRRRGEREQNAYFYRWLDVGATDWRGYAVSEYGVVGPEYLMLRWQFEMLRGCTTTTVVDSGVMLDVLSVLWHKRPDGTGVIEMYTAGVDRLDVTLQLGGTPGASLDARAWDGTPYEVDVATGRALCLQDPWAGTANSYPASGRLPRWIETPAGVTSVTIAGISVDGTVSTGGVGTAWTDPATDATAAVAGGVVGSADPMLAVTGEAIAPKAYLLSADPAGQADTVARSATSTDDGPVTFAVALDSPAVIQWQVMTQRPSWQLSTTMVDYTLRGRLGAGSWQTAHTFSYDPLWTVGEYGPQVSSASEYVSVRDIAPHAWVVKWPGSGIEVDEVELNVPQYGLTYGNSPEKTARNGGSYTDTYSGASVDTVGMTDDPKLELVRFRMFDAGFIEVDPGPYYFGRIVESAPSSSSAFSGTFPGTF